MALLVVTPKFDVAKDLIVYISLAVRIMVCSYCYGATMKHLKSLLLFILLLAYSPPAEGHSQSLFHNMPLDILDIN